MKRIVAFVTILLPVALLAAQAGNNPLFSTKPYSKINLALTRLAHHPYSQHTVHAGKVNVFAPHRTGESVYESGIGLNPVGSAHAPVLLTAGSGNMTQTLRNHTRKGSVTQLAQEEEEEEDDGDDEGGEGEQEESEPGWDRTWDAPKLG